MTPEQKAYDLLVEAAGLLTDAINDARDGSYQQEILAQIYLDICKSFNKLHNSL